jgi:FdrA protein
MTIVKSEIRKGAYYDSVVLMQLQRSLLTLPGVIDAGAIMATPANRDLLAANGLLPDATAANPDDLLIVVKAGSASAAAEALAQVDTLLTRKRATTGQEFRPRSLDAAIKQLPDARWVLVSVPGRYAAGVARDALALGRHVFLYSDNVTLDDEIALKQTARSKGLLVMGPDCGTAIVNGVGLGFANRVRRGSIGLVGASGTGLQAIISRIHELGEGVSHAIGTGGRDLKAEVGGITAHQALAVLARDPETRVIVIVSKPPAPEVAIRLLTAAQATGKPVVVDFIGYAPPGRRLGNLHFATTLSEAADMATQLVSGKVVNGKLVDGKLVDGNERSGNAQLPGTNLPATNLPSTNIPITNYYLRGLFSGGTLAYEALLMLQTVLYPIYSNAPITTYQLLSDPFHSQAHAIVDLGSDEFTVGRLHPMLDNDLRIRRLRQEAADPEVAIVLLDVVLGEGAHPDPAGELGPVIKEAISNWGIGNRGLEIVAIVIGTEDDPQDLRSQIDRLTEAGAVVFRTTNEAVEYVALRLSRFVSDDYPPVSLNGFTLAPLTAPLTAINVGLESFYASLKSQGANAVQVDWRPPAGGNEKMAAILAKMKKEAT